MPEGEVVQSKKSFMGMPVSSVFSIQTSGDIVQPTVCRIGVPIALFNRHPLSLLPAIVAARSCWPALHLELRLGSYKIHRANFSFIIGLRCRLHEYVGHHLLHHGVSYLLPIIVEVAPHRYRGLMSLLGESDTNRDSSGGCLCRRVQNCCCSN